MIYGVSPYSWIPFSYTPDDYSVASPFSGLIADQEAERIYLLHATPYDAVGAAEVDVYFSANAPDIVFDGKAWPARLQTVLNSETHLFTGDSNALASAGRSSFGIIKILIGDEENEDILDYLWDGRSITVYMGGVGFDFSEFQPIFIGTAGDIEYDHDVLSIVLRDKAELLQLPLQENTYAGTGGLEGGSDLKGEHKPVCYGRVFNASPVLVDRSNLIYQVHDEAIQSVDAVYDGALALTSAGDVADITATSVTAGQYKTQLSGGYIRLGAEPSKQLTADLHGDASGSGYVETAADVIEHIFADRSVLAAADLNLASFAATNVANSSPIGYYKVHSTIADAITEIIQSIGGSWVFNRAGQLELSVFQFNSPVGSLAAEDIIRIRRLRTPTPTWRRSLGYAKSWTVQNQNEVVAGASAAQKDFVSREFRFAVSETASIKTRRILAGDIEVKTLLETSTSADTEATRQQNLFGADRDIYEVLYKRQQFKYRAGQTVIVNHPRFGFPKNGIILSLSENTDSKTTSMRIFT